MERRDLLRWAAVSLPAGGVALATAPAYAQRDLWFDVVKGMVDNPTWADNVEIYRLYRWGAFTYDSLVRYFGAPDGNVPDGSSWQKVNEVLPQAGQWVGGSGRDTARFVHNHSSDVIQTFSDLLEANSDAYDAWLSRIGIVPSGQVSVALLSGQALATFASLAADGSGDGIVRRRIKELNWWFFPFCW